MKRVCIKNIPSSFPSNINFDSDLSQDKSKCIIKKRKSNAVNHSDFFF